VRRLAPALIVLALVMPASANAAVRQLRIFQDDRMLIYGGPLVRAATLDAAKQMGVDVIRAQFVWRNIALRRPANASDPASYGDAWSNWDSLVIEARKRGMDVLATVTGPAPSWAAGTTGNYYSGSRYPNANAFGQFVEAVGRRYSGNSTASLSASMAGLFDGAPCTPLPPLVSCGPTGPAVGPAPPPPPPDGGTSPPPPSAGPSDQSPPPPPGSGVPTPPPAPGTKLPRIALWSIYNEPNHPLFVSPQREKGVLIAPSIYRALYRTGWSALAGTGHRSDTILLGETMPIGTNQDRETSATSPLAFTRELFCLNGTGPRHPGCSKHFAKLPASGWAIHPYYRKTGPFSRPPGRDDLTPATLGHLQALLVVAARKGRVSGRLPLWDTENGSQTRPPDPKGTTPSRQARYINEAEYLAWCSPSMRSFSQYLMTDEQPVWAFQSGLLYLDGKPKPALDAYRLPIYVKRAGNGVVVWGHVPGGSGSDVTIHPSRGPDAIVHLGAGSGYFTKRLRTRASSYTLRYGSLTSRSAAPR
jgi:hypothetical protein